MSIFDPISVLKQRSEWPVVCDRCYDSRSLQISDDFDEQMALLDASYLQSWFEEREYLEKLTELFESNPESRHPFKVRILKTKFLWKTILLLTKKLKN